MAIKIKNNPAMEEGASAHAEAADQITTDVSMTATKNGEIVDQSHDAQSEAVKPNPLYEYISVGTSFKMPVADYTMLEFSVRRTVPFDPLQIDPDKVFEETKTWVEAKMNSMIEEQQSE